MPNPDVSIVITNFNRARFLARSIRSCLSQHIVQKVVEVVVVDDCSEDDSETVLKEFESDVLLHSTLVNSGVSAASNLGLKMSSGRYFLRVDADDFISQQMCGMMSAILDANSELDFIYADHIRIDERTGQRQRIKLDNRKALFSHGAGVMFRRGTLQAIGGYDETLRNAEDFDLLVRLELSGAKGFYLPVPLYRYYIHGENITLAPGRDEAWKYIEEKYNVHFG